MKKQSKLPKIQASTNEVVKALRKQASEGAKAKNLEAAILITFEKDNIVGQLVTGDLKLFKALGALEILKQDLLNQADQMKKGEI